MALDPARGILEWAYEYLLTQFTWASLFNSGKTRKLPDGILRITTHKTVNKRLKSLINVWFMREWGVRHWKELPCVNGKHAPFGIFIDALKTNSITVGIRADKSNHNDMYVMINLCQLPIMSYVIWTTHATHHKVNLNGPISWFECRILSAVNHPQFRPKYRGYILIVSDEYIKLPGKIHDRLYIGSVF